MSLENTAPSPETGTSALGMPREPRLKEATGEAASFEERMSQAFDDNLRPMASSIFARDGSTARQAKRRSPGSGLDETVDLLEAQRAKLDAAARNVAGLIRDREREIAGLRQALLGDRTALRDIQRAQILVDAALRENARGEG